MKHPLIFLLAMLSVFTLKADEPTPEFETTEESSTLMPTYGNWCGRNHPLNPESADKPVDILDAICQRHDLCYVDKGHMSCECDSEFVSAVVSNLKEKRFTGSQKVLAHTFRAYFRGSPCSGNPKDKLAPTRMLTNATKQASRRTEQLINRIKGAND